MNRIGLIGVHAPACWLARAEHSVTGLMWLSPIKTSQPLPDTTPIRFVENVKNKQEPTWITIITICVMD